VQSVQKTESISGIYIKHDKYSTTELRKSCLPFFHFNTSSKWFLKHAQKFGSQKEGESLGY